MYYESVRQVYDHLSPSYRRIADFLLAHYHDAAFMNAAQLGRACKVDTTSVVRFAQRLGYPGFPELIAEVQEQVKRDLRAVYEPHSTERTPEAVYRRCLLRDRENLDELLHQEKSPHVETVVQILKTAPRIFVVGESAAGYLAESFAMRLASFSLAALVLPGDAAGRVALTIPLRPGDALIALGLTTATPGITVATQVAREEGAHTIAIASSPALALARVAEYVLYAPARSAGIFYSLTAAAAVLNALLQALALSMGDAAAEWALRADYLFQRYQQVWNEPIANIREIISEYSQLNE